jgi:hypothetical protein
VGRDVEDVMVVVAFVLEGELGTLGVAVAVKVPFLLVDWALPVPTAPVPTAPVPRTRVEVVNDVVVKAKPVPMLVNGCEELVTVKVNGFSPAVAEAVAARKSGMTW